MKTCVLFPGRFQPFHNGHVWVVKNIIDLCKTSGHDTIVFGLGSCQSQRTQRNPFTVDERENIILISTYQMLSDNGISPRFVHLYDIDCPTKWPDYVMKRMEYQNLKAEHVFMSEGKDAKYWKRCRELHTHVLNRIEVDASSSEVRLGLWRSGSEEWKKLVCNKDAEEFIAHGFNNYKKCYPNLFPTSHKKLVDIYK